MAATTTNMHKCVVCAKGMSIDVCFIRGLMWLVERNWLLNSCFRIVRRPTPQPQNLGMMTDPEVRPLELGGVEN